MLKACSGTQVRKVRTSPCVALLTFVWCRLTTEHSKSGLAPGNKAAFKTCQACLSVFPARSHEKLVAFGRTASGIKDSVASSPKKMGV